MGLRDRFIKANEEHSGSSTVQKGREERRGDGGGGGGVRLGGR